MNMITLRAFVLGDMSIVALYAFVVGVLAIVNQRGRMSERVIGGMMAMLAIVMWATVAVCLS